MDRDIALNIKTALASIKTTLNTLVTNTTPDPTPAPEEEQEVVQQDVPEEEQDPVTP